MMPRHSYGFLPIVLLAVLALPMAPTPARADVITFAGAHGALFAGTPTAEGVFTYDVLTGGLFRDWDGNPDPDMEGYSGVDGGVMTVARNDVAGGLFTFDGADVRFEYDQAYAIKFTGLLGGVVQGVDLFTTTSDTTWTTHLASNLSGVSIDQLLVTLDAGSDWATDVDNLVLTPKGGSVPEPAAAAFLGASVVGLQLMRRRR